MIQYLNTDLDLVSADDLTTLAASLEAHAVYPLHVERREDGLWYATFEASETYEQPESNIASMLTVIESLSSQRAALGGTVRFVSSTSGMNAAASRGHPLKRFPAKRCAG